MFNLYQQLICDAPEPWLIGFQDGASPTFEGITELHDAIFFYLIVIGIGVTWVLGSVVSTFMHERAPMSHRYYNHGTLIELVWTVTPAFVLIAIAFPSFKLLYMMDFNELTMVPVIASVPIKLLPLTTCTALVPLGAVGITLGMSFTVMVRNLVLCPPEVFQQLVGHLLGDGHLSFGGTCVNPYFVFVQAVAAFAYGFYVFTLVSHFCKRVPDYCTSIRNGTRCTSIRIQTRSFPFFHQLFSLFYHKVDGKWVKFISPNLMPYLTPIALAFWIMDDGTKNGGGMILCCPSFTATDVYLLCGMLHYNFGFTVTTQKSGKSLNIRISAKDKNRLRQLVTPYMHPSKLYKLS